MSDKTGIEWTDATWNPIRGCSLVSDGCRNCYAMHVAARFNGIGQPYEGLTYQTTQGPKWTGKIKFVPKTLLQPLQWQRPRLIFVNSMSDLFHESVAESYIDQIFAVMALAHWHVFQVLTKRPDRMREYCKSFSWTRLIKSCSAAHAAGTLPNYVLKALMQLVANLALSELPASSRSSVYPLPNVWLGVSVEDQGTANERVPILLDTPSALRWLSMEPLLGPVDLQAASAGNVLTRESECKIRQKVCLDWVVVGGESGTKARPMHPDWVRSLRDQCTAADIPFMFKQWGEWYETPNNADTDITPKIRKDQVQLLDWDGSNEVPSHIGGVSMQRLGKKVTGRLLDGVQYDGYPKQARREIV